jgi:glycosyltransferase involved in cell wall biosynthesis
MRFLCVSDFVRDDNAGSAGSILAIGAALSQRGHQIDYLWRSTAPSRLPHPSLSRLFELPRRQYRQVKDQLRRAQYNVVIVSQPYAYLVYEKLPRLHPHTLFLNRTHGWEDRFNSARLRFTWDGRQSAARRMAIRLTKAMVDRACVRTLRACHGLIAPSSRCAKYIQAVHGGETDKIAVIPYGVGEEFLRRSPSRCDSTLEQVRMLYVGNYLALKGSDVLESLLPPLGKAYPQSTMTFIVPNDVIERVRSRFAPAFGNRLTILNWHRRSELPAIYAGHDILLFPSLFEGFGKTFLEAMVCGLCVVGFGEGGLADIATSGQQALYCETGDVDSLKALLERCLQSAHLTRDIGRRAQQVAQKYSWARTAERTEMFCLTRQATKLRVRHHWSA